MCRPVFAALLLLATAPVALAGEEVRPCRDRVVRLPGLAVPVEIACEFDIDLPVLSAAMGEIERRGLPKLAHVRIDHAIHPIFSPAIILTFVDEKKDSAVTRRTARVDIQAAQTESKPGASACGRVLRRITTVTVPVREKILVHEAKLTRWVIGETELIGELRGGCDAALAGELLAAVLAGTYLEQDCNGPDFFESLTKLDGLVDQSECRILPEKLRPRALRRPPEGTTEDDLLAWLVSAPRLAAGKAWPAATLARLSSIELDAAQQTFTIWLRRSMTSWEGARFRKVEGVWVKWRGGCGRYS